MIKKSVAIGAMVGAAAGGLFVTGLVAILFVNAPGAPGLLELALLGVFVLVSAAGGAVLGGGAGLIVGFVLDAVDRKQE